jgi:BMFP domain-containing protein YqiC
MFGTRIDKLEARIEELEAREQRPTAYERILG